MTRRPSANQRKEMKYQINDEFRGDNDHLRECIKALIELDDDKALVPHGIGGHARALLASAYHRIEVRPKNEMRGTHIAIAAVVLLAVASVAGMLVLHWLLKAQP